MISLYSGFSFVLSAPFRVFQCHALMCVILLAPIVTPGRVGVIDTSTPAAYSVRLSFWPARSVRSKDPLFYTIYFAQTDEDNVFYTGCGLEEGLQMHTIGQWGDSFLVPQPESEYPEPIVATITVRLFFSFTHPQWFTNKRSTG